MNPTENAIKQKQQYTAELQVTVTSSKLPWTRAEAMKQELQSSPALKPSSAWVIYGALEEWKGGMELMKQLQRRLVGGHVIYDGPTGALDKLANAIL